MALPRTDVFKIVDRVVSEFVERTGQTVQISALGGMGPTIVRIYNGRPALLTTLHVGAILPLLTSATGRIFLAFLPASETAALVNSEAPPPQAADIEEIRSAVRASGQAVETGTVIPGLHATAFPILDLQGRAVLAATALTAAAKIGRRNEIVAELGGLCVRISAEMGWQPP